MGVLADWQIERDVKITPFRKGPTPGQISSGLSSYGYDLRAGFKFKVFSNAHCAVVDPKNFDPRSFVEVDLTPVQHEWNLDFESMREPRRWFCPWCDRTVPYADGDKKCPVPDNWEPCPKREQPENFVLIPPNSFALAESVEWVEIPRDCIAFVADKSTYRRVGILMGFTILEPEWRGIVTLEISNSTPLPAKVYAGEGVAQMILIRTDGVTESLARMVRQLAAFDPTPGVAKVMGQDLQSWIGGYGLNVWHDHNATCRVSYEDKRGRYQDQSGLTLPTVARGEKNDAEP